MRFLHKAARQRPGRFMFGAALLVALVGFIAWPRQRADGDDEASAAATPRTDALRSGAAERIADEPAPMSSARTTPTPAATLLSDWPASLRDSAPDGAVTLDANGRVQASVELRRLFDYFLTALGERDVAAIRDLLLAHVRSLHGEVVAAEVAALFDRYVDFQQALAAMNAPPGESLRARLARVRDLRQRLLDPAMAEAFFGDEDRYTAYTLDRRDLLADTGLDERTREQRLEELAARLSPEQRASMREANAALLIDEQNRQFDALQLDPAQRQSEREALFGTEAAQRLAQADAEQAAWDARVRAYVLAREAIRADVRLDAAARERAIAQLRARSFDAPEQRRIQSLEAVRQL
ncbi:MAG TPA: lipase secretion chaperone [Patescibacteria group bacterium]|nr:lipase secretion chaperone [Patescibacteria group bacterium]